MDRGRRVVSLSVGRVARRLRSLAVVVALLVFGAVLASAPPAVAGSVPDGATTSPPEQQTGSVRVDPSVPVEQTQGRAGVGGPEPEVMVPSDGPAPLARQKVAVTAVDVAEVAGRGFVQGESVEDVSARSSHVAVWVNPDGSRTAQVFNEVAFVPDGSGGMRPVARGWFVSRTARDWCR